MAEKFNFYLSKDQESFINEQARIMEMSKAEYLRSLIDEKRPVK